MVEMRIGLLGPPATYSERALKIWASQSKIDQYQPIYLEDPEEIAYQVARKKLDLGIIPLENSIEGSWGLALDLLREYDLRICGEVVVPIDHCLLAKSGLESISKIASHPQALAQCRNFLRRNFPNHELIHTPSTSAAAQMASRDETIAAIAPQEAAQLYGLKILLRGIQDHEENYTRFILLGTQKPPRTGRDKTSIIVYLERDRPGALYDILEEFAIRKINLTKIESRPSRKSLGDYLFYIDFEGHEEDQHVEQALAGILKKVYMIKLLGSYPRAI